MKKGLLLILTLIMAFYMKAQKTPCTTDPVYRQFDFWIGEWDVYAKNGKKAGDSKIDLILDSCIILENWKSANVSQGVYYAGKSFNTYNAATKQWQQTWVDNTGNTTEFLRGNGSDGKIVYYADKVMDPKGKSFMRRLTFTKLSNDKVRQFGERSDDEGKTWTTEYDLEYRRKK